MQFLPLIILSFLLFVSCKKHEEQHAPIVIQESVIAMDALKAAKVVAYRFAIPGEGDTESPQETGFSLISQEGVLDFALLNKLEQAKATLTSEQVNRLVDAVYDGRHKETGPAACYDPHHVFLFYNSDNVVINVVEVCFGCINLRGQPQIGEEQWYRHDFRELARICDESGIG
jgi:hypothetical protein